MITVNYKPLTVNQCWQGKRFKTPAYEQYERDLLFLLPKIKLSPGPYKLCLVFGMSNDASDIDNPVKAFCDILQKKYGFNDKEVYRLEVDKVLVKKGEEFIKFEIINLK